MPIRCSWKRYVRGVTNKNYLHIAMHAALKIANRWAIFDFNDILTGYTGIIFLRFYWCCYNVYNRIRICLHAVLLCEPYEHRSILQIHFQMCCQTLSLEHDCSSQAKQTNKQTANSNNKNGRKISENQEAKMYTNANKNNRFSFWTITTQTLAILWIFLRRI